MAGFYDEMQAVASELLGEFRQGTIRYIALTPGTGPKDNPGPAVETPFDLDAVARGVSFKYVDNSAVLMSDLQTTFAVRPDMVPDIKGFIEMDGKRHKIERVIRKPAAGTPVAYTVVFKK